MNPADWETIKHFTVKEFDSPDKPGSGMNMDYKFIITLDQIREEVGFPLPVNSGYRTPEFNSTLADSVDGSAHESGLASDLGGILTGRQRYLVMNAARTRGITRIGIGKRFLHLDMDMTKPQNVYWVY